MSLIEEALRRAKDPLIQQQQQMAQPQGPPPASVPEPAAPAPRKRASRRQRAPSAAHSWTTPPSSDATPPTALPRRSSLPLAAAAAVILGLSLGLLIGGMRWVQRELRAARPAPAPAAPAGAPAASAAIPPAPAPAPPRKATLVLSGIVGGLGQPYAVINGAIVSEGERIGTAVLVEITKDAVRLRQDDGTDLVLKVPH